LNDYPETPFNSQAQGVPTTHSTSDHDTGAPSIDRFESKGIHTASPPNKPHHDNTSTIPQHGFTAIEGTQPGSTTYKPSDDSNAPVHFQDSLAGQNVNWNDPNKLEKSSGTHVPGQTSGVNLKKTTEDRSVPHPESHMRGSDDGVKFAEPPTNSRNEHQYTAKETQKPSVGDKVLGKAEQVMGKIAGDSALQEKGAARAQHGLTKN